MKQQKKNKWGRWHDTQAILTILLFCLALCALCIFERRDLVAVCLLAVSALQLCDICVTAFCFWKCRSGEQRVWLGVRIVGELIWTLILINSACAFLQIARLL